MTDTLSPELFEPITEHPDEEAFQGPPSLSYLQDAWRRFRSSPIGMGGLVTLVVLILFATIGPYLNAHTYYEVELESKNLAPSTEHWFGTDDLGRDVFTRTAYGARISLFVGIAAATIDLVVGVVWGSVAAFAGGRVDEIMMRIADILYALPYLLVVVLLMVVLGSGLIPILIAMTVIGWINMARIVRGQILQLKSQEFVLAAQALGASFSRILLRHLIPNAMGPIIVTVTLTVPTAIFVEAFLSFLGLGVQAPIASWGTMANDGLPALRYYPWRLFFPALFISMTMLSFNLVGDSLRDALDPKLRR
ncbi:Oligopeptide transport system permease protein OppC [Chlamydiales bacterium SCGC AG-110-P3]|nr:Oligopeptide transport system permease protein OppC [Chlamydiales bacterium SCGC AG-110-P3]